jgi:hypothetical protein
MVEGESALVVHSGVAAVAVAFFQEAVLRMIPYAVPSFVLLLLDLLYGIKAAKRRGEKVRVSTAVRRSVTKMFSYICWLILASTLAISFHKEWLEWAVLGLVYVNEFASIVGNYLETKGIGFSFVGLYRWILKVIAGKVGEPMEKEDAEDIIVQKVKPRDSKGRFVKRA